MILIRYFYRMRRKYSASLLSSPMIMLINNLMVFLLIGTNVKAQSTTQELAVSLVPTLSFAADVSSSSTSQGQLESIWTVNSMDASSTDSVVSSSPSVSSTRESLVFSSTSTASYNFDNSLSSTLDTVAVNTETLGPSADATPITFSSDLQSSSSSQLDISTSNIQETSISAYTLELNTIFTSASSLSSSQSISIETINTIQTQQIESLSTFGPTEAVTSSLMSSTLIVDTTLTSQSSSSAIDFTSISELPPTVARSSTLSKFTSTESLNATPVLSSSVASLISSVSVQSSGTGGATYSIFDSKSVTPTYTRSDSQGSSNSTTMTFGVNISATVPSLPSSVLGGSTQIIASSSELTSVNSTAPVNTSLISSSSTSRLFKTSYSDASIQRTVSLVSIQSSLPSQSNASYIVATPTALSASKSSVSFLTQNSTSLVAPSTANQSITSVTAFTTVQTSTSSQFRTPLSPDVTSIASSVETRLPVITAPSYSLRELTSSTTMPNQSIIIINSSASYSSGVQRTSALLSTQLTESSVTAQESSRYPVSQTDAASIEGSLISTTATAPLLTRSTAKLTSQGISQSVRPTVQSVLRSQPATTPYVVYSYTYSCWITREVQITASAMYANQTIPTFSLTEGISKTTAFSIQPSISTSGGDQSVFGSNTNSNSVIETIRPSVPYKTATSTNSTQSLFGSAPVQNSQIGVTASQFSSITPASTLTNVIGKNTAPVSFVSSDSTPQYTPMQTFVDSSLSQATPSSAAAMIITSTRADVAVGTPSVLLDQSLSLTLSTLSTSVSIPGSASSQTLSSSNAPSTQSVVAVNGGMLRKRRAVVDGSLTVPAPVSESFSSIRQDSVTSSSSLDALAQLTVDVTLDAVESSFTTNTALQIDSVSTSQNTLPSIEIYTIAYLTGSLSDESLTVSSTAESFATAGYTTTATASASHSSASTDIVSSTEQSDVVLAQSFISTPALADHSNSLAMSFTSTEATQSTVILSTTSEISSNVFETVSSQISPGTGVTTESSVFPSKSSFSENTQNQTAVSTSSASAAVSATPTISSSYRFESSKNSSQVSLGVMTSLTNSATPGGSQGQSTTSANRTAANSDSTLMISGSSTVSSSQILIQATQFNETAQALKTATTNPISASTSSALLAANTTVYSTPNVTLASTSASSYYVIASAQSTNLAANPSQSISSASQVQPNLSRTTSTVSGISSIINVSSLSSASTQKSTQPFLQSFESSSQATVFGTSPYAISSYITSSIYTNRTAAQQSTSQMLTPILSSTGSVMSQGVSDGLTTITATAEHGNVNASSSGYTSASATSQVSLSRSESIASFMTSETAQQITASATPQAGFTSSSNSFMISKATQQSTPSASSLSSFIRLQSSSGQFPNETVLISASTTQQASFTVPESRGSVSILNSLKPAMTQSTISSSMPVAMTSSTSNSSIYQQASTESLRTMVSATTPQKSLSMSSSVSASMASQPVPASTSSAQLKSQASSTTYGGSLQSASSQLQTPLLTQVSFSTTSPVTQLASRTLINTAVPGTVTLTSFLGICYTFITSRFPGPELSTQSVQEVTSTFASDAASSGKFPQETMTQNFSTSALPVTASQTLTTSLYSSAVSSRVANVSSSQSELQVSSSVLSSASFQPGSVSITTTKQSAIQTISAMTASSASSLAAIQTSGTHFSSAIFNQTIPLPSFTPQSQIASTPTVRQPSSMIISSYISNSSKIVPESSITTTLPVSSSLPTLSALSSTIYASPTQLGSSAETVTFRSSIQQVVPTLSTFSFSTPLPASSGISKSASAVPQFMTSSTLQVTSHSSQQIIPSSTVLTSSSQEIASASFPATFSLSSQVVTDSFALVSMSSLPKQSFTAAVRSTTTAKPLDSSAILSYSSVDKGVQSSFSSSLGPVSQTSTQSVAQTTSLFGQQSLQSVAQTTSLFGQQTSSLFQPSGSVQSASQTAFVSSMTISASFITTSTPSKSSVIAATTGVTAKTDLSSTQVTSQARPVSSTFAPIDSTSQVQVSSAFSSVTTLTASSTRTSLVTSVTSFSPSKSQATIIPSTTLTAGVSSVSPSKSQTTIAPVTTTIPTTVAPTTKPIAVGLCHVLLKVVTSVNIGTAKFKNDLESNLVKTYNLLTQRRKRRAVTQGSTTVNVTSIARQGTSENVDVLFYVKENNAVVNADKTTSTLNQLTVPALSERLNQTLQSTINVAGTSTVAPTTIAPPASYQLLGMVLRDDVSNNISSGNNRALFESRMANNYKTGKNISGNVMFTIFYLIHEVKNIVYLEFYVTVDNVRQNSTTVASYYRDPKSPVTGAALSALVGMTVITVPYSLSSITSTQIYQVQMTIKPVSANTNMNSAAFKNDFSLRLATLYRLGKDAAARRKRRALSSISATIISLTTSSNNEAVVVFYILDQGNVIVGSTAATTLNKIEINQMSTVLGVEVIKRPSAVEIAPGPASSSDNFLWIIGVVVGACVVMLIFFACLYWRWKAGGPERKLDLEKIQMAEKTNEKVAPYGGYRDIVKYAEGRSQGGGPGIKTTAFTEAADTDEKPDLSRSMRRKVKPRDTSTQRKYAPPPSARQNPAYEESEEDEDDDVDEDDDDYESDVPPPRKTATPRPVSAQRKVEVQPGPGREFKKAAESVQKTSIVAKSEDRSDEEETESEEEAKEQIEVNTSRPAAAELPPLQQMKDVQEAPSYPPVRFRTNIEPEASTIEHLPPIMKHASLTGRKLPEIDTDLQQKADLERSRNKQRQRLRASGRRPNAREAEQGMPKTRRRDWRKAQSDIDAILDPMSSVSRKSPRAHKRAKRRHRLRRSNKVDINIDGKTSNDVDENRNVKLNSYMRLNSPVPSSTVEDSDDLQTKEDRGANIEEARDRIHTLLDDAFSILGPYQRPSSKTKPKAEVVEERLLEGNETTVDQAPVQQAPALPSRYTALPPPPHGRATAPLPGERKRIFNYPMIQTQAEPTSNGTNPITPVLTRDPMVVMDRSERNRYLSQRLGQSAYTRPYNSFAYPYEQPPSEQPVYITPVQQLPDGYGGRMWSPYAAEAIKDEFNNSAAPLFNTMPSPMQERYNLKSTPIASTPKSFNPSQPRHTSIDMSSFGYGGTPQPLIRAIKDELVRLSQSAKGRTQIQELPSNDGQPQNQFS